MATESDLRDLLRDPDPEGRPAIDLDAVLSRARRRRRPKVIAAQALGSVAAVGALFVGVAVVVPPPQQAAMIAQDTAAGGSELYAVPETSDELLRIPAEACGATFDAEGMPDGWTLTIEPLTTDGTRELVVPVTLRNDGTEEATGTASLPRIVITLDGEVVGVAPAVEDPGVPITVGPGMSTTFETVVQPYSCEPTTDGTEPGILLPPGDYEMRPVLRFAEHDDGGVAQESVAIVGAPQSLVIR